MRLVFTTDGGTLRRRQRALVGVRVTDAETGRPVAGHSVVIRGWRAGRIALRERFTTNRNGNATAWIRLRETTRLGLRSPATGSTRPATSPTSIRWRVR